MHLHRLHEAKCSHKERLQPIAQHGGSSNLVVGKKMHIFIDDFSRYYQVTKALVDNSGLAFATI